jgi:hypothetical protein
MMTKMKTERNKRHFTKSDAKEMMALLKEKKKIEQKIERILQQKVAPALKKMFGGKKIDNWYVSEGSDKRLVVFVREDNTDYWIKFDELAKGH